MDETYPEDIDMAESDLFILGGGAVVLMNEKGVDGVMNFGAMMKNQ